MTIAPESVRIGDLPSVEMRNPRAMPPEPGIYFALGADGSVLYIGRAASIRNRWASSHHRAAELGAIGNVRIAWLLVDDVEMLAGIEAALIEYFEPPLNGRVQADAAEKRFLLRMPLCRWWRLKAAAAKLKRDSVTELINEWIEAGLAQSAGSEAE